MSPGKSAGGRARLLVLVVVWAGLRPVSAAELPLRHMTPQYGVATLPSASVQAVSQDRFGFIWLGFYSSGVARFDGHSMETFGADAGVVNTPIRVLAFDPQGYLWVGGDAGLVVSTTPLGPGFGTRFGSGVGGVELIRSRVRQGGLVVDGEGRVWVATTQEITTYRHLGDRIEVGHPTTGVPGQGARALAARANGAITAALEDGSLVAFETPEAAPRRLEAPSCITTLLAELADGSLWGGCVSGQLWRRDPVDGRFEIVVDGWAQPFAITAGADGNVWVASIEGGLYRLTRDDLADRELFTGAHGLLGRTLWALHEDHEGTLWIGQNGGVSRLGSSWRAFLGYSGQSVGASPPHLPSSNCFSVLPPSGDEGLERLLFVGTGGGLAVLDEADRPQTLTEEDGLHSRSVYDVERDAEGRVWSVGHKGASVLFPAGSEPPPGLESRQAVELHGEAVEIGTFPRTTFPFYLARPLAIPVAGSDETTPSVWLAGAAGLRTLYRGAWIELSPEAGLPASGATSLAMDGVGHLWVGTSDAGLFRSVIPVDRSLMDELGDPRAPARPLLEPIWNTALGAGSNNVRTLEYADGDLWVGTGVGLFHAEEPASGRPLRPRATGITGSIGGLAVDRAAGTLWAADNQGLVELALGDGSVRRRVSSQDGLKGDEAWAYRTIALDREGAVYFASSNGTTVYRPSFDRTEVRPLPVVIRDAVFEEDALGRNRLDVSYALLSYRSDRETFYRTRVLGYDDEWSPPSHETRLRYTNLPAWGVPRRLRVEVVGSVDGRTWSTEPSVFPLVVHPPVWGRWWAMIAYAGLVLGAVGGVSRARTRRLEARAADLEAQVASRTAALRSQKQDLETLDDIVRSINEQFELEGLLQDLLGWGLRLFPQAEKAAYLDIDRDAGRCRAVAARGYELSELGTVDFSLAETLERYHAGSAEMLDEGVHLIRSWRSLPGSERLHGLPEPKSMLSMDVVLDERLEGLVVFDNFSDVDAFGASDLERLRRFRRHAVSAISKARLLDELARQRTAADRANEAKSRFLATMSHEIRTPLNAILGFVQLMRREEGRSQEDLATLATVARSGEHLRNLINDVLSMAKIEAEAVSLDERVFDLRAVLEGIETLESPRARAKGIGLEVSIEPTLSSARVGDEVKVRQVVFNLIDNAIKFTHEGRVWLRVEGTPDAVAFEIGDTGPGMEAAEVASLFRPFVQTSTGLASREGTGLGLAICRSFVGLMGGEIAVDSAPGRGTVFRFSLRLAAATSAPTPAAGPTRLRIAPGEPCLRNLVVDDREENRVLLVRLLRSFGLEAREAADGEVAVSLWQEWGPDVVWMDVRMEPVDGIEATRTIRRLEAGRSLPRRTVIVAVTASAFEREREDVLAAGCDAIVLKPYLDTTIADTLRTTAGLRFAGPDGGEPGPPSPSGPSDDRPPESLSLDPEVARRLWGMVEAGDVERAAEVVATLPEPVAGRLGDLVRAYRLDELAGLLEPLVGAGGREEES